MGNYVEIGNIYVNYYVHLKFCIFTNRIYKRIQANYVILFKMLVFSPDHMFVISCRIRIKNT